MTQAQSPTPYEIDISVNDERWHGLGDLPRLASDAIAAACAVAQPRAFSELSIALVDDATMQGLNQTYRQKDRPTNVLSFPSLQDGQTLPVLGDIVLGYETLMREAGEKSIAPAHHVQHLLIHGFYHLQGMDHQTNSEADAMEALETQALARLGIANPYEMID